jgi:hypothetical protein
MEHRFNPRIIADVKVLIYKYCIPMAVGRIKNGTGYGLYIESDFTDVGSFQLLGLEILFYSPLHILQRFKFNTIVTHTTDDGFGVELDGVEGINDQLCELLRDTPPTPLESELNKIVARDSCDDKSDKSTPNIYC